VVEGQENIQASIKKVKIIIEIRTGSREKLVDSSVLSYRTTGSTETGYLKGDKIQDSEKKQFVSATS